MNKREMDRADSFRTNRMLWIWAALCTAMLPLVFLEDEPIRVLLKDYRVQPVFQLMRILTWLGNGWVLAAVAVVFVGIGLWRKRPRLIQTTALSLIALAVSGLAVQVVKHLIGRPRPKLVDRGVFDWGPSFQSGHDSFPSGHAVSAFAMAAVLSSFYPSGRWIWYSLAVLVAFTRVYIGAHFPSDVFVGAALGMLTGIWAARLKLEWLES